MKKIILTSTLFLIFVIALTTKVNAPADLDINNNTNCSFTADIYFYNGSCGSLLGVSIPANTSFTVTNPLGSWAAESI